MRVLDRLEHAEVGLAVEGEQLQRGVASTGQHRVCSSTLEDPAGHSDGIGGARTCRRNGAERPVETEPHRDRPPAILGRAAILSFRDTASGPSTDNPCCDAARTSTPAIEVPWTQPVRSGSISPAESTACWLAARARWVKRAEPSLTRASIQWSIEVNDLSRPGMFGAEFPWYGATPIPIVPAGKRCRTYRRSTNRRDDPTPDRNSFHTTTLPSRLGCRPGSLAAPTATVHPRDHLVQDELLDLAGAGEGVLVHLEPVPRCLLRREVFAHDRRTVRPCSASVPARRAGTRRLPHPGGRRAGRPPRPRRRSGAGTAAPRSPADRCSRRRG